MNNNFFNRYYNFNTNPYIAKNKLVKKADVHSPLPTNGELPDESETGYIAVGVFTALGALPVENALVTVYDLLQDGSEHLHSQVLTDGSGRIPDIELPVVQNPLNSTTSPKYYFTNYNLRVKADNFYTVNVLGIRIFPGIKTNYKIDLIPVFVGETEIIPEQTFIIPQSPLDQSNK